MTRLAGGFIRDATPRSSNSEEQKKAEEGPTWNIEPFLTGRDKLSDWTYQSRSHGSVLFGGRPAVNSQCQHRRPT
jgi:hypothetical protein